MVNSKQEQIKTVMIGETFSWEFVPQGRGLQEETVCVKLDSQ